MVVMLTAVFFINPFSDAGPGGPVVRMMASSPGSVRTLNSFEGNFEPNFTEARSSVDTMIYFGFWIFRIFVAALCFGWITLKSMPRVMTNSRDSVQYWRFRKQAEMDIQKVCYKDYCSILHYYPFSLSLFVRASLPVPETAWRWHCLSLNVPSLPRTLGWWWDFCGVCSPMFSFK